MTCCCASTTPPKAHPARWRAADRLDPLDLRRCFALVSQTPALFFGSVEENIRYGKPTQR
jgi:ABC-type transport system involved in cytochrome bd biosynthesis fused ATPase/permease subunit